MNHQLRPFGILRRSKTILLHLLLCTFAAAQGTTPISALEVKYRKRIFKNDRVSVFLLEIPPGHASMMHRHDTDILSIFMAGGETKGTIYGKPPREDKFTVGEVRFRSAGFTHSTENTGANVFRSVIIEFGSSMGTIQSSKPPDSRYCNGRSETACVDEKYLFCTTGFCVKEISIAPGAVLQSNRCASDHMLIGVSNYELSYHRKGKAARVLRRKSGDVEFFRCNSAHQWANIVNVPARVIDVVFR